MKGELLIGKEAAPVLVAKLPPGAPAPAGTPGTDIKADGSVVIDETNKQQGDTSSGQTPPTSSGG